MAEWLPVCVLLLARSFTSSLHVHVYIAPPIWVYVLLKVTRKVCKHMISTLKIFWHAYNVYVSLV